MKRSTGKAKAKSKKKPVQKKKQSSKTDKAKGKCFHCDKVGHWKRNCSKYTLQTATYILNVMHGDNTNTKRRRSSVWTRFTKYGNCTRCKCNYCGKHYGCTTKNGIKSLWNHFSSSLSITSNLFFHELCSIETELTSLAKSDDSVLSEISSSMKSKFDKYWGKIKNVNKLLIIALVLDPRYKLDCVKFCFGDMFDDKKTKEMTCDIRELLIQLYEYYKGVDNISNSDQTSSSISLANVDVGKANENFNFLLERLKMTISLDVRLY
ncbi:hypothetical protein ACOSQ3_019510 [Xanthoceras sorbifolium]